MAAACFPKEARLLQPAQFTAVLQAGKSAVLGRSANFVLHGLPQPGTDSSPMEADAHRARLGLVIGKRFEKRSVRRNAIKRVLRESFRLHAAGLPSADLVFRLCTQFSEPTRGALKAAAREQADHLLNVAEKRLAPRLP